MKVFAPERVLARTCGPGYIALPLAGGWVDVPDYFRQITTNKDCNDVIHAKIVDLADVALTLENHTLVKKDGTEVGQVQQVCYNSWQLSFSYWPYETRKEFVELAPSPNYKGKNSKKKFGWVYSRTQTPFCGYIQVVGYGTFPGGYDSVTVHVDCLPKVIPDRPTGSTINTVRYECNMYSHQSTWRTRNVPTFFDPVLSAIQSCHSRRESFGRGGYNDFHQYELQEVYRSLTNVLRSVGSELESWMQANTGTWWCTIYETKGNPYPDFNFRELFLYDEPWIIEEKGDPLLAGVHGGLSHHWIENYSQHALLEACNSLPRLSDNSISNLIEVVGFIKALVVDHKIEMPKSLADAWLAYRYQYSTTKADIEDAIKFVNRHIDLGTLDQALVGRSVARYTYLDSQDVTFRCGVKVTPKETSWLNRIWRALNTYGLTPDFYVLWDMVPYSFMVDWFLPVSDIASVWDANAVYFSGEFYTFDELCYSLKYTRMIGDYRLQFYTRWSGSVPSSLNSLYWFDAPSATSKTVGKRILDAASIFIGR